METSRKVMEIGERLAVKNRLKIETAVVATGLPRAVQLWNKMKRRSPGASRAVNNAS